MQKRIMEHYQPHNSIDPSLPQPPFFTTTSTVEPPAISQPTPISTFTPSNSIPNQTSYDEMIMAAISALREKDGSSRQAIARYIDRVYTNLPSNHSILLTNHLKKLKNCGQLIMNKHSYLLPGSAPPPPLPPPPYTTTPPPVYSVLPPPAPVAPPISATVNDGSATGASSLGASPPSEVKKRGRPRKPKPDVAQPFSAQNAAVNGPVQAQYQNYLDGPNGSVQNVPNYGGYVQNVSNGPNGSVQNVPNYGYVQNVSNGPNASVQNVESGPVEGSIKRRPGRPRKEHTNQAQAQTFPIPQGGAPVEDNGGGGGGAVVVQGYGAVSESEAMLVSLGLSDGPVSSTKMRPRRAVKPTTTAAATPQTAAETGQKRRPGRPRKLTPIAPGVWPVQVPVGALPTASATSSGTGRGRGRPRKYPLAVVPVNGVVNNGAQVQHKKRGRKPKSATQDAGFSVPVSFMMPEQMNGGGGVMMPQTPYTQAGGAAAVAAASGGVDVPVSDGYNGVVHSVPGKRGRGRPPGTSYSGGYKKPGRLGGKPLGRPRKNYAATQASEDQSFDIVNLKNKIDYLQSKIMEALPIIKSCINAEEPNVMGALGQLEELATVDFTATAAPVNVQNQQQPPAQLLQAEHQ